MNIYIDNDSVFVTNENELLNQDETEKFFQSLNHNERIKQFVEKYGALPQNDKKQGRPKGRTKRTIDRYKKVFHQFEISKKKYSSKAKAELYELLATVDYDEITYTRKTIRNIIEDKKYNLIPSR